MSNNIAQDNIVSTEQRYKNARRILEEAILKEAIRKEADKRLNELNKAYWLYNSSKR